MQNHQCLINGWKVVFFYNCEYGNWKIEGDFEIVYVDFKPLDKLLGIYSKREGFFNYLIYLFQYF